MAYRYGERAQSDLFPPTIEEYVASDDSVRVYDAFVNKLDFDELGIAIDHNKIGNPQYDPKAMLKLFLYGTSYGFRSSRKLERAVNHNISFIWLTGGLKPDHKTISEFRRKNKSALKGIIKQCAHMCIKLNLIDGNTLFVDGTKIRGNASIKNTWSTEKCKRYIKFLDKRIDAILDKCEATDVEEQDQQSLVKMDKELASQEVLKTKVENILNELKENDQKSINTVDPECTRINSVQGTNAGYNAQAVVDEKHGLIVNTDVVSENNDVTQFASQINQANETTGKKCKIACADSGYANTEELKKIDDQKTKVIVPTQKQASRKEPKEFDKEHFEYDAASDTYICPAGHRLKFKEVQNHKNARKYKIKKSSTCHHCRYFGKCTTSKNGRTIMRLNNEKIKKKLEVQYNEPESQKVYKLRQQKSEPPFGHIKRNLGVSSFLLRGIKGANAEMAIMATCYNLVRMINIMGIQEFIAQIKA